jgi:hypothetical protein
MKKLISLKTFFKKVMEMRKRTSSEENIDKTAKKRKMQLMPQHPIHQQVVLMRRTKKFFCATVYYWKKDHLRKFTVTYSICKLLLHKYCSKVCEMTNAKLCEQCAHKLFCLTH